MAIAMAVHSNTNARLWRTEMATGGLEEPEKNDATNVATTSAAPVTNHFNCRRSSPTDARNRATTATRDATSAATRGRANSNNPTRMLPEEG